MNDCTRTLGICHFVYKGGTVCHSDSDSQTKKYRETQHLSERIVNRRDEKSHQFIVLYIKVDYSCNAFDFSALHVINAVKRN